MSQTNEQVMHQALDALTDVTENCEEPFKTREAIKALNEALAAQAGQQQARWYCIDKSGMATLCADQDDALQNAMQAQGMWPHHGPHRAVQLFEHPPAQAGQSEPAPVRQPLTHEQIDTAYRLVWSTVPHAQRLSAFARAIEAKINEGRT